MGTEVLSGDRKSSDMGLRARELTLELGGQLRRPLRHGQDAIELKRARLGPESYQEKTPPRGSRPVGRKRSDGPLSSERGWKRLAWGSARPALRSGSVPLPQAIVMLWRLNSFPPVPMFTAALAVTGELDPAEVVYAYAMAIAMTVKYM